MELIATQVQVPAENAPVNSIGSRSRQLIKEGHSNAVILEMIRTEFPQAKTTVACIAWYKSDMRKKGLLAKKGFEFKTVYMIKDGDEMRQATEEEVAEMQVKE